MPPAGVDKLVDAGCQHRADNPHVSGLAPDEFAKCELVEGGNSLAQGS